MSINVNVHDKQEKIAETYDIAKLESFYGGITINPDTHRLALSLQEYCENEKLDLQDFITLEIDGLYELVKDFNVWCAETGKRRATYSPVYVRSFQNYLKRQHSEETIEKAIADSALIDHAMAKLLAIINDDSFSDENSQVMAKTETENGSSIKRQKWDKLKALDILLKYASTTQTTKHSSAPSTALKSLLSGLLSEE